MAKNVVNPVGGKGTAEFNLNSPETLSLIAQAQESDAFDHSLTIRQALRKYKKAVLWAMFLSTSLIMEVRFKIEDDAESRL